MYYCIQYSLLLGLSKFGLKTYGPKTLLLLFVFILFLAVYIFIFYFLSFSLPLWLRGDWCVRYLLQQVSENATPLVLFNRGGALIDLPWSSYMTKLCLKDQIGEKEELTFTTNRGLSAQCSSFEA